MEGRERRNGSRLGAWAAIALLGVAAAAPRPASAAPPAQAALDETVATVNGDLVLKSDILWSLALDPAVAPAEFWRSDVQEMMLRTIVDQRLLLQEAARLPATQVTDEELQSARAELAAQFNGPDDPTRFERRLELVGLTEPRLRRILRDRLQITKFVDFRFRSFVIVTTPEITDYFETEILPTLPDRGEGAAASALAANRDKIQQLLVEEKINNSIESFLEDARARAEVVRLDG